MVLRGHGEAERAGFKREPVALAQRGTVTYDTPVRKGADGNWVLAKRVRGLFLPAVSDPSQKQPADTLPQNLSQPLASDPQPTPTTTPSEGPSQLSAIGNIDAICPYCNQVLKKKPGRKKKCPSCNQFIYVRTRPSDKQQVLLTETQAEEIEEQWSIVNGTHAIFLLAKRLLAEEEAKLAKRFGREPSDKEVESSLLNQARIEQAEGQLDEIEDVGSAKLGMMVEWSTAGDNGVCNLVFRCTVLC